MAICGRAQQGRDVRAPAGEVVCHWGGRRVAPCRHQVALCGRAQHGQAAMLLHLPHRRTCSMPHVTPGLRCSCCRRSRPDGMEYTTWQERRPVVKGAALCCPASNAAGRTNNKRASRPLGWQAIALRVSQATARPRRATKQAAASAALGAPPERTNAAVGVPQTHRVLGRVTGQEAPPAEDEGRQACQSDKEHGEAEPGAVAR